MWFFSEISFAAASAPVRAARKTGLFELFAMTAMRIVLSFPIDAAAPPGPGAAALPLSDVAPLSPAQANAPAASVVTAIIGAIRARIRFSREVVEIIYAIASAAET